jgi:hypothetical protein
MKLKTGKKEIETDVQQKYGGHQLYKIIRVAFAGRNKHKAV